MIIYLYPCKVVRKYCYNNMSLYSWACFSLKSIAQLERWNYSFIKYSRLMQMVTHLLSKSGIRLGKPTITVIILQFKSTQFNFGKLNEWLNGDRAKRHCLRPSMRRLHSGTSFILPFVRHPFIRLHFFSGTSLRLASIRLHFISWMKRIGCVAVSLFSFPFINFITFITFTSIS